MQTALREGAAVIGAEAAGVSVHEDEAQRFRVAYVYNYPPDKLGTLIPDADDTHGVEAMRTGKTLAISDTHGDPRVVTALMDAWDIKSVICAPLVVRGRPIAVAYFSYHAAAHRFSEQEIEFVTKLASSLSGALENAQLYEREAETASLTQVLNDMNGLINTTLDAQEIMQTVVEQAGAAMGVDSTMVALRHGDDWVAEYGYPAVPGVIHESIRADEAPFMVAAVEQRRPIAIDDCETDPRCIPEVQGRFGVRSVLCLPLIVREEVSASSSSTITRRRSRFRRRSSTSRRSSPWRSRPRWPTPSSTRPSAPSPPPCSSISSTRCRWSRASTLASSRTPPTSLSWWAATSVMCSSPMRAMSWC